MGTFQDVISSLRKEMDEKHSGKGFFLIIVLRLFSYFITRENMKALIKGEDFKIPLELVEDTLKILAVHDGFFAEIKARLWVYKGESM